VNVNGVTIRSRNQLNAIEESQQQRVDESKRKKTVCVHWLADQCKKGDRCEFLHVYDPEKIPPCRYFQKDGTCHKGDKCQFQHTKAVSVGGGAAGARGVVAGGGEAGAKERQEFCPYYERGFCKIHWFSCPFGHNTDNKELCVNYLIGFCPKGPDCELYHLKGGVIADSDTTLKILANFPDKENWTDRNAISSQQPAIYQKNMQRVRCYNCGEIGHKSSYCIEEPLSAEEKQKILAEDNYYNE
jgi:cleavage and polyadenylation specificity factor subunit 4